MADHQIVVKLDTGDIPAVVDALKLLVIAAKAVLNGSDEVGDSVTGHLVVPVKLACQLSQALDAAERRLG